MNDLLRQDLPHTLAPALAMPVGGIGTGSFAIGADGSLRQWQLLGMPNHRGALPGTGFWIRMSQIEPPLDVVAMLQGTPVADPAAPMITDGEVPAWMREAATRTGTFRDAAFSGTYPLAEVRLSDPRHPVTVRMRTFNPMVPGDVPVSSIPVGMIEIELTNTSTIAAHGTVAGSLLNAVGWDGITPIGDHTPGLGGNVNRLLRGDGWTRLLMDNPALAEQDRLAGSMSLAADDELAAAMPRCGGVDQLIAFLGSRDVDGARGRLTTAPTIADPQLNGPRGGVGPSPAGRSWLGVIGVPFALQPGQSRTMRFTIAWHFPNRFVDGEQFGASHPEWGSTAFYLGNRYAAGITDADDVHRNVARRWAELDDRTRSWTRTLVESDLDGRTVDRMAAQAAYVRSPTCFIGADGRFYGYEGTLGASTTMWSGAFGGSCPLNCTHVWQYEAALAALWPTLEQNMQDTEFDVMQAPDGAIPHRLRVPTYLPQMWDEPIGGPEAPALDGMLATILKTLRNVQHGAGTAWARHRWPQVVRLYRHLCDRWDPDGDGVLRGRQPSTHDIDLAGVNPFMGTLWLAALRALERLGEIVESDEIADDVRHRFASGSRLYDTLLFDGTQYVQLLDDDDPVDHQWRTGTLSDQLVGQWWAHQLGLGYVLPPEHVRSALAHVVATNLRGGFDTFEHPYRRYADAPGDRGLVMCSWPDGERPAVPTRYADEVWTGVEYQVAAHCLFEGLRDESDAILDAMWNRHDGSRRNPYNEIECGDHYARAMAGWTVLQARTGVHVDELAGRLTARRAGRWPWVASTGWGHLTVDDDGVRLVAVEGSFDGEVVTSPDGPDGDREVADATASEVAAG